MTSRTEVINYSDCKLMVAHVNNPWYQNTLFGLQCPREWLPLTTQNGSITQWLSANHMKKVSSKIIVNVLDLVSHYSDKLTDHMYSIDIDMWDGALWDITSPSQEWRNWVEIWKWDIPGDQTLSPAQENKFTVHCIGIWFMRIRTV